MLSNALQLAVLIVGWLLKASGASEDALKAFYAFRDLTDQERSNETKVQHDSTSQDADIEAKLNETKSSHG